MPKQLFTNNAETVLNGTLSAASTTVTLSAGSGAAFPSITGGNYFLGTIYELNGSGLEINHEIVKVTARVADSMTVVRAFDNTTARDYPDNNTNNPSQVVYFSLRWTAFAAGNSLTTDDNLASVASAATARTNLGLGTIATQDASNVNVSGGVIAGITDLATADGGTGASTAAGARANLGAAVNGANNDITSMSAITGGVGTPDYIDFDTAATTTGAVGRARWDDANGTMQIGLKGGVVSLQVGQEVVAYVRNAEATDLAEGEVVYIFGAQGDKATVKRASNASEATSSKSFGMVTEPIAAGQLGFVTVQGVVNNLNTNAFTAGDFVWLGATAGTITNTRPNPPAHAVLIGVVEKSSVGGGAIYVNIFNGVELDELHDVYITSKANDDSLFYNSTTGLWTNRTPANARTALGVTATGADTTYLHRANNLSDLANAATARTNLGVTATGADTTYTYRANNLSDLANAATARTNLGLGTAATTAATDYATAAQGTLADGSAQKANNLSDLTNAATARTNLGLAIGTNVQAYDVDTAKLDVDQSWTGSQRGAITTDNDLSFDLSVGNNFTCTPTGTGALTFTNHTAGQSGYVLLINTGGYAITAAATTKVGATFLSTISTAGVYLISYYDTGTNAYCTTSGALS